MTPQLYITTENNTGGVKLAIINDLQALAETYLQSNTVIGATSFLTENTASFAANDLALFAGVGAENAEIKTVSSITNSETLVTGASVQNHNRGESLQKVIWNQIVIDTSSDNVTWSNLTTISIDPTRRQTTHYHTTGLSSTYYRVSFKNSVTSGTSNFSLAQQATQTNQSDSVASMLKSVKVSAGISDDDAQLTDEFLMEALNDARDLANQWLWGYQFDWRQQFEYPVQIFAGRNYIDLPSDMDFTKTDRSTLAFRIPTNFSSAPLPTQYVDKRLWNDLNIGYTYTYTSGATLSGATSLILDNSGNLPESGTIRIACDAVNQTILEVTYTGNTEATNTLTGVSGITRNIPDNTQVFISNGYGYPYYFTIFDERMWFTNPFPQEINGKLGMLDYYVKIVPITSLGDIFPEKHHSVYKSYLKYAIKYRKDNTVTLEDSDYLMFKNQVETLGASNYTGQYGRIKTS